MPDPKVLHMTVGLPYSGKSTWARQLAALRNVPIVNPDSIRLALHAHRFIPEAEGMVWSIAKIMVRALFLAGHDEVILDATNTTRQRRDEWKSRSWLRNFVVIGSNDYECRRRAQEAGDDEIIPIIERMSEQWEDATEDELTEEEREFHETEDPIGED